MHAAGGERGHVEHAAAADGGELRAVADQSDGGARLVGNGQERERGVLVEHARLIDDDPLAARESSGCRGAGVRGIRIGVVVADGEPRPHAVAIPPPPVLVHELGDAVGCNAELLAATSAAFFVGVTTRVLRPCTAAASIAAASIVVLPAPAAPSTTTSDSADATAAAARACAGSSRRSAASASHGSGVRAAAAGPGREQVAQPGLDGDDVHARQVRDVLGMRALGRQHRQAVPLGEICRERDELAQRRGSARTPASVTRCDTCSWMSCTVHVDAAAAQRSSARDATSCTSGRRAKTAARERAAAAVRRSGRG